MPGKMRIFGKYAGYSLFALLLFIYFSVLTFPFDVLKDRLLSEYADRLPFRIFIEKIQATPFLWLQCSGIEITQKGNKEENQHLDLQKLQMRPSLLKLIIGIPALRIKGMLYQGKIKGTAGKNKRNLDISLDWEDIQLDGNPLLAKMEGSQLAGKLSGNLLLHLKMDRWVTSEGTFTFQLDEGSVSGMQIRGFTLPDMKGITGKGEMSMAEQKATLETLTLTTDLLSSSLDGKVDLKSRFTNSRVNFKGKVKLTGELATQYQPMLAGILRNKDEEDFHTFSLKGTIRNPRFSF